VITDKIFKENFGAAGDGQTCVKVLKTLGGNGQKCVKMLKNVGRRCTFQNESPSPRAACAFSMYAAKNAFFIAVLHNFDKFILLYKTYFVLFYSLFIYY